MDNLPVENVGDGEGTFIAGVPNKHLNINDSLTCAVARAYLVKAYSELTPVDRTAWSEAQDRQKLGFVSWQVKQDLDSDVLIAYMFVTQPNDVFDFVVENGNIVTKLYGVDDADMAGHMMIAYDIEQAIFENNWY